MIEAKQAVLLVEGDILVRHPLADYLRECGFRVMEASTGEEAERLLKSTDVTIDVVIADMTTPGSGFALLKRISEQYPAMKVILAGSIEKATEQAGTLCHEGRALTKPYEHRLVLDRIRQALARREALKP